MVHVFHSLPTHKIQKVGDKYSLFQYYRKNGWTEKLTYTKLEQLLAEMLKQMELSEEAINEINAFRRWVKKPTINKNEDSITKIKN